MSKTKIALMMAVGLALLGWAAASVQAQPPGRPVPPDIAAAVGDSSRPQADRDRDALRHPAEMVEFAGIRPGDKVADLFPSGGYFTRVFSKIVGPRGRVYAWTPDEIVARFKKDPATKAIAAEPGYRNITVLVQPTNGFKPPEKLDVVWTSQNYHDLHNKMMGPANIAAFNRSVYDALKPGGVYVVLDHAATTGSGLANTEDLHRIDPAAVRQEVEKAGFVFAGQSDVLRNPADPHTAKVFDPEIRGHTDQFIYRFRKPRR
jgi:predicted methyltransferase